MQNSSGTQGQPATGLVALRVSHADATHLSVPLVLVLVCSGQDTHNGFAQRVDSHRVQSAL